MQFLPLVLAIACLPVPSNSLVIRPSPSTSQLSPALALHSTNTATHRFAAGRPTPQYGRNHSVEGASSSDTALVHVTFDEDWKRFADKGSMLRCMMESTDEEAGGLWDPWERDPPTAASPWKGTLVEEFNNWYWHDGEEDQDTCYFANDDSNNDNHSKIENALVSLGLSIWPRTQGGDNVCYSVNHYNENSMEEWDEQRYDFRGQQWQATGASYRFGLNPTGSAIFAQNLLSPMKAADGNWDHIPSVHEMPELRLASDIMFAYWLRQAHPKKLQYYFVHHIINVDTVPILMRILQRAGHGTAPQWPGVSVQGGSEEGAALIGSPISATFAYMLLQHKAEIGSKTISEIVIFREHSNDEFPELQLLFKTAVVTNPIGEPEDMVRRDGEGQVRMGRGYVDGVRTHLLGW